MNQLLTKKDDMWWTLLNLSLMTQKERNQYLVEVIEKDDGKKLKEKDLSDAKS